MSDTQTCSGRDMSRFPTRFLCTWNRWWEFVVTWYERSGFCRRWFAYEYPVQFVPPHMHGPEFVPAQIINLSESSLCGHFQPYSVNDPHHLGGGLLAFLFSPIPSVIHLSAYPEQSANLTDWTSCHFFALSDCPGQWVFRMSHLVLLFGDVYHDVKRLSLSTLIPPAPSPDGSSSSSSNRFLAKLHYFLLFVFRHFLLCFPSQMYSYFSNQRFTVVSLCILIFFSCYPHLGRCLVSISRTTDSLNGML